MRNQIYWIARLRFRRRFTRSGIRVRSCVAVDIPGPIPWDMMCPGMRFPGTSFRVGSEPCHADAAGQILSHLDKLADELLVRD